MSKRMREGRFIALFLGMLINVLPVTSFAADKGGSYALEGPGRVSCRAFAEIDASSDQMKLLAAWTLGYLSAHNRILSDTYDLTPWQNIESVLGLTRQYCLSNGEATYEESLQELMRFLAPDRLQAAEPIVQIGSGPLQAVVYGSTIKEVRQILEREGYALPKNDEALATTLQKFQRNNALPETGILDQATLLVLFRD
ncbi:MAG: peptidoglycan-binding domain-containing protein [Aliishimia sp.]